MGDKHLDTPAFPAGYLGTGLRKASRSSLSFVLIGCALLCFGLGLLLLCASNYFEHRDLKDKLGELGCRIQLLERWGPANER